MSHFHDKLKTKQQTNQTCPNLDYTESDQIELCIKQERVIFISKKWLDVS